MAFFLEAPLDRMAEEPKQFICNVCSAKFFDEDEFRKHATSHKNRRRRARKGIPRPTTVKPKPKPAETKPDSPKTFNQAIDNVIGHLQLEREEVPQVNTLVAQPDSAAAVEEKAFVCETCKMAFALETELRSHMNTHKDETQYACNNCDMQFADKETLRCHMMVHDNNTTERPDVNKYHCVECGKEFTLKRTLKGDQDVLPQRCTKCYMKAHMMAHATSSYRCLTCRASFDSKEDLTNHMTDHNKKKYECETCGKTFFDRVDLAQHLVQHNLRTKNGCNNCPATSGEVCQEFLEKKNMDICHCNLCGRAFRRLSYLQRHMMTHTGPSSFKCLECKKSFSQKNRMNEHLLGSCGKKGYECEKCQKSFYQKHNLMMHYLVHGGNDVAAKIGLDSETVHKCDKCDRTFCELGALEQHHAIHTDKEILKLKLSMEKQAETERNVSNQYPTVAHILDSPPVNRTAVHVVQAGNKKIVQIVENPVSQPSVQADDNTQFLSSPEMMQYQHVAHTQEVSSGNIHYLPVAHTQEVYAEDVEYQQVVHTQEIPAENVQYQQVVHIPSDGMQYHQVAHTQEVISENTHYQPVVHAQVVSSTGGAHYQPVVHQQEVMRPQDQEIYQAVQHLLDDRDSASSPELVTPYPTERVGYPMETRTIERQVVPMDLVAYATEPETYAVPDVRPQQEENAEKSKFQMIVQTMCNLLNSRSGS